MTISVVRRGECAPQPWRNGGGITRELARRPVDGGFCWRLSVADVDRDGPFSEFPGIDRVLVLLHGAGMTLRFDDSGDEVVLAEPLDRCAFAGERPVSAVLVNGPTVDLNLMWRRGTVSVDVAVVTCGVPPVVGAGTQIAVVGSGPVALEDGGVLEVGDAVVAEGEPLPRLTGSGSLVRFVLS